MKKSSLEDVAKAVGVSKTLVSMVLNGKATQYGISKKTEERVWKMVEEMGFKPNATARKLRTGKSNVLGLIVADISNPFYAKIARSIEDAANKKGYHMLICSSDENPKREADLISILADQHQVDGLIVSSTLDNSLMFDRLHEQNTPFLLLDREFATGLFPSVTVDNRQGAEMLVQHLIDKGTTNIGLITLSPSHLSTLKDRVTGYKDALLKNKLEFKESLLREVSFENLREDIMKEVDFLLSAPQQVKAIFALNNLVALYTLEAIHQRGLSIPKDVALVSFDDIELFKFTSPPITAISQPLEKLGEHAMDLLFNLMNKKTGEPDPQENISPNGTNGNRVVLPVELMIRQSCG
jgi:LacI family transcriptional regulator